MIKRITIQVATRDRHSEAALLLQSLRTQTYQEFDVVVLDDASGTPLNTCHFFMSLVARLQLEGHGVRLLRQDFSRGVCAARNKLIELDPFDNPLVARIDDDVLLQQDYLEKLVSVLDNGFDVASGVVPLLGAPEHVRDNQFVKPIINYHELDGNGFLVKNNDDCGYCYLEEEILPTHQFRTNALMKKEVLNAGVRYPDYLTKVGFREEGFFSFQAILKGFKIGVHTGAVAYHLQTPSGGCRSPTYPQDVQLDDATFRAWIKARFEDKGDFLRKED